MLSLYERVHLKHTSSCFGEFCHDLIINDGVSMLMLRKEQLHYDNIVTK